MRSPAAANSAIITDHNSLAAIAALRNLMLRRVMIGVSGQANDRPVADLEARFDYIAAMNGPGGGDRPSSEKGGELQAPTSQFVSASITRYATLHRMASVKWQDVLETNFGSCFNICRSVI